MVQWRNGQMSLCDGFWAREVGELWPAWMRVADGLLEDEELIEPVYQAQGKRWKQSRTRTQADAGRSGVADAGAQARPQLEF